MLFQQAHRFCDGSLELWIVSGDYVFGPILDVDVGSDAFILNGPPIVAREEPSARGNRRTAIDKSWGVGRVDQTTPGAFADQQANLPVMKHVGHQVAA